MGAPNELSFLPDDYLERKARRRANAICAVLFFVVISAIGGAFTVTEKAMREIDDQHAHVTQQFTDAAKRIVQVQQLQEKQRTMAHQAELTASLIEKVPRSRVLAEITNDIPTGVSLLDFSLNSTIVQNVVAAPKSAFELRQAQVGGAAPAAPMAQARVYDVLMKISGIAHNDGQVSQFISKLNGSDKFQDVNLIFTDEFRMGQEGEQKMRKFEIEMKINPNAVVDPKDEIPVSQLGAKATAAVPVETR